MVWGQGSVGAPVLRVGWCSSWVCPGGSNPSAAESSWVRGRCPLSPNLGLWHRCRGAGWPKVTWLLGDFLAHPQAKAERNYHIFYQLCASANLPELQDLGLREFPTTSPTAWLAASPSQAGQCQAALPSWVLEEALLPMGTPGWDEGGWEPHGAGCAGSQPDPSRPQVGQSPSTTLAKASTPLPRAPTMRPTWTARDMPSRSWVLSWLGTGWGGGEQGWSPGLVVPLPSP